MINISAAMGGQFAWTAAELTEEVRRIGPNPLRLDPNAMEEESKPPIAATVET
jgi:hypothetical protein